MDAESSEGQVAHLNSFASIDLIEFNTIEHSSKSSTCLLEPIPTKLMKELLPVNGAALLNIVNVSLVCGHIPQTLKLAALIKKPNLDMNVLSNNRPISNLSKVHFKTTLFIFAPQSYIGSFSIWF